MRDIGQIPRIFGVIVLILLCPSSVLADGYASPEALLEEMQRLQSKSCDLTCHIVLAEMYSDEYLNNLRNAVLDDVENEEHRENALMISFGEKIPLAELREMSAAELFARQTWNTERNAPPEWLIRNIELKSREAISENEIRTVVVRSGIKADPGYSEESFMTFIKQGGGWKIKH